MQVFKHRKRMVNFRLSDDEYQNLKDMCLAHGSRSISDFARSAVWQAVSSENGSSNGSVRNIESAVLELRGRFEQLDREVKRLSGLLAHAPASAPPKPETIKPLPNAPASPPAKAATINPTGGRGGVSKGLSREKLCATLS